MFYRPNVAPNAQSIVRAWRDYFKRKGVGDPYIVMAQVAEFDPRPYGMDAAAGFPPHGGLHLRNDRDRLKLLNYGFNGSVVDYDLLARHMLENGTTDYQVFPGVCPDWDNNARKPGRGYALHGSTPAKYGLWLKAAIVQAMATSCRDERIVFINAWNEWAEGAYLEPDQHHGCAFLAETRRVMDEIAGRMPTGKLYTSESKGQLNWDARPAVYREPFNKARRLLAALTTAQG
jgi:hypothetical protein